MSVEKALEEIKRGTAEIIDFERIEKLVKRYYETGETYTVKAGFDPTGADLHLGHTVLLQKLRIFRITAGVYSCSSVISPRPSVIRPERARHARYWTDRPSLPMNRPIRIRCSISSMRARPMWSSTPRGSRHWVLPVWWH
jgi:hypothetical protein